MQYLLDRDIDVEIPAVDAVRNAFATAREALGLALDLERTVTEQVGRLASVARDEGDYLGGPTFNRRAGQRPAPVNPSCSQVLVRPGWLVATHPTPRSRQ